ncbi:MAG: ABC transporter permease [Candidatus Bathyarchaeia archaeon]
MLWLEDATIAFYIALKDARAYYLKPPNISWGMIFPIAMSLALTLRNPSGIADLVPGLIGMATLFGTTSMAAVTITFEKRIGSLERLLLAPISLHTLILGKVLGGSLFGLAISLVMVFLGAVFLQAPMMNPWLLIPTILIATLAFSALGCFVSVVVKEVFEAQTLANLFRFPMIFLSGVFLPIASMPFPAQLVAYLLRLTYVVDGLRYAIFGRYEALNPLSGLLVTLFYAIVFFLGSVYALEKRKS